MPSDSPALLEPLGRAAPEASSLHDAPPLGREHRLPVSHLSLDRKTFHWTALLCGLLLAALAAPALLGRVYTADDLGAFHLPMRAFYADCLARGEPFDWSGDLYCGFYMTGEGQAGTYHPLHLLLYRLLPLGTAFDLECLASYPLMLIGTYWFLRRWRMRRDAALFGAMTFTFSGFCMLHFVHVNGVAVVAHLPWLLAAIDVAVRDPRPNRRMLAGGGIALLTGSQLLLGYPQFVWLSLLAEAGYAAWLLCGQFRLATAARLAGWKVLGLMIGGVQLLPTLDALAHSTRQTVDAAFRNSGSLDPLNIVQLVAPYLLRQRVAGANTHELGLYAGSVTLMLAVWCVVGRAAPRKLRPLARAAMALGSVGLLLALGEFGPLHALTAWLPLIDRFRFPCRAIVLVHLALAVLAAIGFAALARSAPAARELRRAGHAGLVGVWFVVVMSVVLALVGPMLWTPHVNSTSLVWVGPVLATTAALLVTLAAQQIRWARFALVALAAADLGAYGMSYAVYPHAVPLADYRASTPMPPSPPLHRAAVDVNSLDQPGLRSGDRLLLAGWKLADGYAGLEPVRRLDYRQPAALRAAGTGWMAAGGGWIELKNPLPRARLVTRTVFSEDPARDIEKIDLDSTALIEPPDATLAELDGGATGSVAILADRPGSIRLQTNSAGRQLLVVSESFDPGWQATVNGARQPVLRANGDFLGCVVGPGKCEVQLDFRPVSLFWGRLVSACGLGLGMMVVTLGCRRGSLGKPSG